MVDGNQYLRRTTVIGRYLLSPGHDIISWISNGATSAPIPSPVVLVEPPRYHRFIARCREVRAPDFAPTTALRNASETLSARCHHQPTRL